MKILILADTHVGNDIVLTKKSKPYKAILGSKFFSNIKKIKTHARKADLIVHLGDAIANISAKQDAANYTKLSTLLNQFQKPTLFVIGNHDNQTLSRKQVLSITNQNSFYFSKNIQNIHHIVLYAKWDHSSNYWSCIPPSIAPKQLNWLKKDLKANSLPTIIYIHYPVDEHSLNTNPYFKNHKSKCFLKNRKALRKILQQHKNILAVISGHSHFFNKSVINGIPYLTIPSFSENNGKNQPSKKLAIINTEQKMSFKII